MKEIKTKITQNTESAFEEAVRYFKGKIPVTAEVFYQMSEDYRNLAFTISGYTSIQIIKKFQEELITAIEEGTTLKTFREQTNDFLGRNGYEGITPFQADNIFRTNIQTAYQTGHYKAMTEPVTMRLRPFWQYDAVNDRHTRPSHLAMDGKVFPADHSVWDTWYPPNGFRCRCTVKSLSKKQVEQRGIKVEEEVPQQAALSDGRVINIMPDPSFGTNAAKERFSPDFAGYPEPLKKAYEKQQEGKSG